MTKPFDDSLTYFLPATFKYKVLESTLFDDQNFECHIRIALKDLGDFKRWLHDFEEKTNTSWIVKKSPSCSENTSYVVNRNYVCQHSSFRKRRRTQGSTKKDKCCEATFIVRIKRNNSCIRYHDPYVKDGLTAIVKMSFVHTHPINDAESWNWLKRSQETRDTFIDYFKKGLSPTEAMKFHQDILKCKDPDQLTNCRKNPPKGWVYALHEKWIEGNSTEVTEVECESTSSTKFKYESSVPTAVDYESTEYKNGSMKPTDIEYESNESTEFNYASTEPIEVECKSFEPTEFKNELSEPNHFVYDGTYLLEKDTKESISQFSLNSEEEILAKWDREMSRLRTIFKEHMTDKYFRGRVESFLNKSSGVWTKDQMCALLEMGII